MDAERIATIRLQWAPEMGLPAADVIYELLDALETAQAESDFQHRRADAFCKAAMRREVENKNLEAERDAARAENTRLNERERFFATALHVADGGAYRNDWPARITAILAEVDRLTNQITDLRSYLDVVANTAFGSNSAGLRMLRAKARELLARCSPNEETAEEKK